MATKDDLIKDLDYLSTTVGERSRVIAGGIIAIWWAALIGKETVHGLPVYALTGPAFFAALSVFFDFAQYAMSYIFASAKLAHLERMKQSTFTYSKKALSYKIRGTLFYLKQICMLAGLGWLMWVLCPLVFHV